MLKDILKLNEIKELDKNQQKPNMAYVLSNYRRLSSQWLWFHLSYLYNDRICFIA